MKIILATHNLEKCEEMKAIPVDNGIVNKAFRSQGAQGKGDTLSTSVPGLSWTR